MHTFGRRTYCGARALRKSVRALMVCWLLVGVAGCAGVFRRPLRDAFRQSQYTPAVHMHAGTYEIHQRLTGPPVGWVWCAPEDRAHRREYPGGIEQQPDEHWALIIATGQDLNPSPAERFVLPFISDKTKRFLYRFPGKHWPRGHTDLNRVDHVAIDSPEQFRYWVDREVGRLEKKHNLDGKIEAYFVKHSVFRYLWPYGLRVSKHEADSFVDSMIAAGRGAPGRVLLTWSTSRRRDTRDARAER